MPASVRMVFQSRSNLARYFLRRSVSFTILRHLRDALLGYLIGRSYEDVMLPDVVREFKAYKRADDCSGMKTLDVPFQMLTSLKLGRAEWRDIALHC